MKRHPTYELHTSLFQGFREWSVARSQTGEKFTESERKREGEGRERERRFLCLHSLPPPSPSFSFSHPSLRAVRTHNLNAWNRLVKQKLTHENSSNIPLTYTYIRIGTYGYINQRIHMNTDEYQKYRS